MAGISISTMSTNTITYSQATQVVDFMSDLEERAMELAYIPLFKDIPDIVSYSLMYESTKKFISNKDGREGAYGHVWSSLRGIKAFLRRFIANDRQELRWTNNIPLELILVTMSSKHGMKRCRAKTLFSTLNIYEFPHPFDRVIEKLKFGVYQKDLFDCWKLENKPVLYEIPHDEIICHDEEDIFKDLTEDDEMLCTPDIFSPLYRRSTKKSGTPY